MTSIIYQRLCWIIILHFLGATQGKDCNQPLGLSHRHTVQDNQLRASSYQGKYPPSEARLGNNYAGWCAKGKPGTGKEWIEISFGTFIALTAIEVEGIQNASHGYFVKTLNLQFSYDGVNWYKYVKTLVGNTGPIGVKQIKLDQMVKAKYMRVYPQECEKLCCLKLDAYGCQKDIKPILTTREQVLKVPRGGKGSIACTAKGQPGMDLKISFLKEGKRTSIPIPGIGIHKVIESDDQKDEVIRERKIEVRISYDINKILALYNCKPVGPDYRMQGINCTGIYVCEASYGDKQLGTRDERDFFVMSDSLLTFPKPPVVTNLDPGSRSVHVKWKLLSFGDIPITQYKVVYKLKSQRGLIFQDGPIVGTDASSATMTGLQPYTDYNLMIVAFLPDDVKRFIPSQLTNIKSSIFRFKTDVAGPSGSPVNVEIVKFTSKTVTLSWQPPPRALWNGPLDGYGVFYTRTEYGGNRLKSEPRRSKLSNGKTLNIHLINLIPWSTYLIELYAFNINEDGSSAVGMMKNISVSTNVDAPVKAPLGLSFVMSDSESITVKWQPPRLVHTNGPINGYFVKFSKLMVGKIPVRNPIPKRLKVNTTNIDGYVIRGLSSWSTYKITIFAFNDFQSMSLESPESGPIQATTLVNEPMISSRNLTAHEIKSRSVILSWQSPLPSAANGPINGYIIYYRRIKMGPNSLSNIRFRTKPVQRFDHLNYVLDGLLPWSTYDIRLTAYNSMGNRYLYSKEKESITINTAVDGPASPPHQLRKIKVGTSQVELSWEDPPVEDWYGPLDGYRVFIQKRKIGPFEIQGGKEINKDFNREDGNSIWMISDLAPWTTYSIRVSVYNNGAQDKLLSQPSNSIEISTEMQEPSGSPGKVKVSVTSSTSFSVSWEEPPLDQRNGVIEGYVLRLNISEGGKNRVRRDAVTSSKVIVAKGNNRIYEIQDLSADTTYSVEIAAYTAAGRGPFSAPVYKTTQEDAPSPPLKLTVVADKENYKTVTWMVPLEPNGQIRSYKVELLKLGPNTTTHVSVNGDIRMVNITQLEKGAGYILRVRASTIKDGQWSDWKTLVAPPPKKRVSDDDSVNEKKFVMIVVLVCFLLVVVIIVIIFLIRRRRMSKTKMMNGKTGKKETELSFLAGEQSASETQRMLDSEDLGTDGDVESTVSRSTDSIQNEGQPEKLDSNPPSSILSDPRHPAIPLLKFPAHVALVKEDNRKKLREEFKDFKVGQVYSWDAAMTNENRWKNRYANIVAYDHSRVLLKPASPMPGATDYINGTYIDSYSRSKAYIATQGPMESTSMDFWQMVWNESSTVIIALTRLEESGKPKCHKYWPSDNSMKFGDISVTVLTIDKTADYVVSNLEVSKDGDAETRNIHHFHFLSWPDHGTPIYPTALLSLRRRVRHLLTPKAPLVVHCSAGVGRTGCFILVDAMLEKVEKEKDGVVDIYNYMCYLRSRRINMLQTEDQYAFVHDAIVEAITCGNTEIPLDELVKVMKTFRETASLGEKNGFEKEFMKLTQNCPDVKPEHCVCALKPGNIKKNRNLDVLPKDVVRVHLIPQSEEEGGGYINAVHADGYRERGSFLLAEAPMKHTIPSFWQMVQEKECNTIVMLNCLREFSEVYPRFWPLDENAEKEEFGEYVIELLSEQMDGDLMSRRLRLSSSKERFESREIQHYQYLAWPFRDIPESRRDVLNLLNRVEATQRRLGNKPIVMTCSDGAGRSGTFAAIFNSIERVKVEQLVDVFQCVRSLRLVRQSAVATSDQYTFIYDMVAEYLDSFDTYANFN